MPQTSFDLVRAVLESRVERLQAEQRSAFDRSVRESIVRLSDHTYPKLGYFQIPLPPIDYSAYETRIGYIHMYLAAHADYVRQVLWQVWERLILQGDFLEVTIFGSGPGSDFVGLLRFLEESFDRHSIRRIRVYLCDRIPQWEESWGWIRDKLDTRIEVTASFHQIDATDPVSLRGIPVFYSRLFFMSYFYSELTRFGEDADPFWATLFRLAREGAKILTIDNDSEVFNNYLEAVVVAPGWRQIDRQALRMPLSADEQSGETAQFSAADQFTRRPLMASSIVWGLFAKGN